MWAGVDGSYGICLDANVAGLCVLHQPSPSTALDTSKSSIESLFHVVEAAEGIVNSLAKCSGRRFTTACVLWSKVLPEQRVVQMTTAMEVDERLDGNPGSRVVTGFRSSHLFCSIVVGVDVGVVVLGVVQLHDLAGDGWFESAIVVCQKNGQLLTEHWGFRIDSDAHMEGLEV